MRRPLRTCPPCVGLGLVAALTLAPAARASDPDTLLLGHDTVGGDHFGAAVAAEGGLVLVGARYDDYDMQGDAGSAYLFDAASGQELFKLLPGPFPLGDIFGTAVALDGDRAIVGAPYKNDQGPPGSAYVFDTTTGQTVVQLDPFDGAQADHFGAAVDISGNVALVGAPGDDDDGGGSGSAYLLDATTGALLHKLTADDAVAGDGFGNAVAISGDRAIVGAVGADAVGNHSGAVYVFDVATGLQLDKLLSDDLAANDDFGQVVDLDGTTAIVGAWGDGPSGPRSGSAYLFDVTTGDQLHKLTADDGHAEAYFGLGVSISGARALVGAERDGEAANQAGAAYLFDVATGDQLAKFTASDADHFDRMTAVALSGDTIVGGAYGADGATPGDAGAAYLFDLTPDTWRGLGGGTPGVAGTPRLELSGALTTGATVTLSLTDAAPSAVTLLFGSFTSTPAPFLGGTLHPFPPSAQVYVFTNPAGAFSVGVPWPGAPSGTQVWFQAAVVDASVVIHGASLSNGVKGLVP